MFYAFLCACCRYDFRVEKKEIDSLLEDFGGDLTLPENFEKTVKVYDGVSDKKKGKQPKCQVCIAISKTRHSCVSLECQPCGVFFLLYTDNNHFLKLCPSKRWTLEKISIVST